MIASRATTLLSAPSSQGRRSVDLAMMVSGAMEHSLSRELDWHMSIREPTTLTAQNLRVYQAIRGHRPLGRQASPPALSNDGHTHTAPPRTILCSIEAVDFQIIFYPLS
jgi:hypothetical protein